MLLFRTAIGRQAARFAGKLALDMPGPIRFSDGEVDSGAGAGREKHFGTSTPREIPFRDDGGFFAKAYILCCGIIDDDQARTCAGPFGVLGDLRVCDDRSSVMTRKT